MYNNGIENLEKYEESERRMWESAERPPKGQT